MKSDLSDTLGFAGVYYPLPLGFFVSFLSYFGFTKFHFSALPQTLGPNASHQQLFTNNQRVLRRGCVFMAPVHFPAVRELP